MRNTRGDRGQILVIVAIGFIVLLGFAALVLDIGIAYATQREERNLTDSASLAGAQELQQPGSRLVSAADRTDARTIAMTNLVNELAPGDPLPSCGFDTDFTDCPIPGTDFTVSMRTPTTNCVRCDDDRSLLVSLTKQDVGTFFAGLFGQDSWDIRQTSVAGLTFSAKYAVITLRPPKLGHPNQNDPNIEINGSGTSLEIINGDIGTNTNLVSSGTVTLESGFRVHHYDSPQRWTSPPEGNPIGDLIQDPNYAIPVESVLYAGPFATLAAADYTDAECLDIIEGNGGWPGVPANYVLDGTVVQDLDPTSGDDVTCYRPGRYNDELEAGNGDFILLTPGVYFLNEGADLNSNYLIGGWTASQPGVAIVLNECNPGGGGGCAFRGEASHATILNAGTQFNSSSGTTATAALDAGGNPVQTTGLDPEIPLTLIVRKSTSPICNVQPFEPSPNCSAPRNSTLKLAGGGSVFLAGVQYAPTDNVSFSGGSSGNGYVGQIVSWTVKYSGGTSVRQVYPGGDGNGVLGLDEACSGSGPNGMDNAACTP
jgi:hypothetical protein